MAFPSRSVFSGFWRVFVDDGSLMTQPHAVFMFSPAGPGADRFKIADDQIIVFDGQAPDLLIKSFQVAFSIRGHHINTPFFTENKTKSPEPVFDGKWKFHIGLCSTDEQVDFGFFLQQGNDLPGPAEVAIARALYGI